MIILSFTLQVYIQPNARKTEISGEHNGYVKIRIQAQALDNRANQALVKFLAGELNIKPASITLIRGHKSRLKTVEICVSELSRVNRSSVLFRFIRL